MSITRKLAVSIAFAGMTAGLLLPQAAHAGYFSYVSSTGLDSNDCSRAMPCGTFQGALTKTLSGGVISCVDTGYYSGAYINQAVTIDCSGSHAPAYGFVVAIGDPTATVVLRNLEIDCTSSPASGVLVQLARKVVLENVSVHKCATGVEIQGYSNMDITIRHTHVFDNPGIGVSVSAANASVVVRLVAEDSSISDNGKAGVRINDNTSASLTGVTLAGNGSHGAVTSSTGGPARMYLDRVTTTANGGGGVLANGPGAAIYLSNVILTGNSVGFYPPIGGGQYISFGNNRSAGNVSGDGSVTSVKPAM